MKKVSRHFLKVSDLFSFEIKKILKRSLFYKKNRLKAPKYLQNRTIGLLFQKSSTRTRVSFEVGIREMGGESLYLDQFSSQMGRGESLFDTLMVMDRYLYGMIIRNHDHQALVEVANLIEMPLINGLSESHHPAQGIADALTIKENVKKSNRNEAPRIAYLGEGNNVALSLIEICSRLHWPLIVASPKSYACPSIFLNNTLVDEKYITLSEDPEEAVRGANVIYTDTWFSMTEPDKKEVKKNTKRKILAPYQVNEQLLRIASPNYIFLHCLPAYRGIEVSTEIIDGPHSRVWQQAENRLHAQKALMEFFFFQQLENKG